MNINRKKVILQMIEDKSIKSGKPHDKRKREKQGVF